MSKHHVSIDFETMKHCAAERGCFYVSNKAYNFIFVLDFPRFEARFSRSISGRLITVDFDDFVKGSIGDPIFRQILSEQQFLEFQKIRSGDAVVRNRRLSDFLVEENYLLTAIGAGEKTILTRLFLLPIIWKRLRKKIKDSNIHFL